MTTKSDGLYGKYFVSRVDHRDVAGGDRDDARYFVLDYIHDKHAKEALKYYAYLCEDEFPQLAVDLWMELRDAARSQCEGVPDGKDSP